MNTWFAVLEMPFLLVAIIFGFLIAKTVRSSLIGRGMTFIALGSLVMAIGHIILMADQLLKENILVFFLGQAGGPWAWLTALCTSRLFYGLGLFEHFRQVMAGEGPPHFTLRIRERAGTYRFAEFVQTPLLRNGQVVGVLGVGRDVTDRMKAEEALRRAHDELERRVQERTAELEEANRALRAEIRDRQRREEALRESEERFARVFEDAPIGMSITDASYRLLKVNRAFCSMLGYTEKELAAKTFLDITHSDDVTLSLRAAEEVS